MKTPDKIYIAETPNKLIEIWSDEPVCNPHAKEHCYIRKDILLEWAKEQQKKWEECINTSKKFPELEKSWINYSGAKIQTEALIEKLNSM